MRTYQFDNPLAERRGSAQLIADALREAIIQGQLTAGEPLRQEQLASHFSVSRIPLREALRCLESEGWIEFLPNRGARVSRLSASEAQEVYEIRASLERTALELAFPLHNEQTWRDTETALQAALKEKERPRYAHRNREFHLTLYRPAERPHLLGLIESMHKRGERYLRLKLEMPFHKRKSDDEHEQIYSACRRGDLDTAVGVLTAHLLETGALLADYLRRGPQAMAPG